ncbi:MAG: oligosaccharide repeat unit polymerase [Syntrophaceae bacterium]|nr:oligosaccharide repeat unit polymerase [Syntrophaceae bacterium]
MNNILIANSLIYIFTLISFIKINKTINIGILVLFFYVLGTIFSYLFFCHPNYPSDYSDITIEPFIYLYGTFLLFLYPILTIREDKIEKIERPNSNKLFYLVYFIIFVSVFRLFSFISPTIEVLSGGINFAERKDEIMEGIRIVQLPFPLSTISYFSALLSNISILIFFHLLAFHKNRRFLIILLGICAFLPPALNAIIASSRAVVFIFFGNILFSFMLYKKFIVTKILKILKIFGIIFLFLLMLFVIAVTISRFGDTQSISLDYWIFKYFGESLINFNGILFGKVENLMYGDRNFSFFRNILGLNNISGNDLISLRETALAITGIPSKIFYTFIGQLSIDIGIWGVLLIALIICFWGKKFYNHHNSFPFSKIIIMQLHFRLCFEGYFFFPFTMQNGNLTIITYILIYLYFKFDFGSSHKYAHNFGHG